MLFLFYTSIDEYKYYRQTTLNKNQISHLDHIGIVSNISTSFNLKIGNHFCIINLLDDDKLVSVGSLSYKHSITGNLRYSKLLEISILPEFRGRGIGSQILYYLIEESVHFGSLYLSLIVFNRNSKAIQLYRRIGFLVSKTYEKSRELRKYNR